MYRERFDGFVSDINGAISMTGVSRTHDTVLCHMLMRPLYPDDLRLLTGLSLAIQSSGPLALRFLMEYAGERANPVALAKKCGLFSNNTLGLDPAVQNFLDATGRGAGYFGLYSLLDFAADVDRGENVRQTVSKQEQSSR